MATITPTYTFQPTAKDETVVLELVDLGSLHQNSTDPIRIKVTDYSSAEIEFHLSLEEAKELQELLSQIIEDRAAER